jgi:PD-(D/E)XK nuclease superfamily
MSSEVIQLSASRVDTFNLCPRKYFYKYERNLAPAEEAVDLPIAFGDGIHRSLATLYLGTAFDYVQCPCGTFCDFCKARPIQRIAAEFLARYPADPDDVRDPRTRIRGLELIAAYVSKWRRESFRVLAVEVPFELELQPNLRYVGKMDLLVEQEGLVFPIDHKTTSRTGYLFDAQFKLSVQISGYVVIASVLTGQPVYQAMINGIRVAGKIDPDVTFFRQTTSRTPEDIAEWEDHIRDVHRLIQQFRWSRFPKAAPYACVAYNRLCEYYQLCTAGAATREHLMESAYKPRPEYDLMSEG